MEIKIVDLKGHFQIQKSWMKKRTEQEAFAICFKAMQIKWNLILE